jgi:hypothetical protein
VIKKTNNSRRPAFLAGYTALVNYIEHDRFYGVDANKAFAEPDPDTINQKQTFVDLLAKRP